MSENCIRCTAEFVYAGPVSPIKVCDTSAIGIRRKYSCSFTVNTKCTPIPASSSTPDVPSKLGYVVKVTLTTPAYVEYMREFIEDMRHRLELPDATEVIVTTCTLL